MAHPIFLLPGPTFGKANIDYPLSIRDESLTTLIAYCKSIALVKYEIVTKIFFALTDLDHY